jgi:iron complex transport system substrate-binding protein
MNRMKINSLEIREKLIWILLPVLFLIIAVSCKETGGRNKPEKSEINNSIVTAHRISIEKFSDYTKITIINPWQGADQVNMTYFLVRRGYTLPPGLDSSMIIMVPVRSIVCMSTTHVAMIESLGEAQTITGMSGTGFIYSPEVRNLADKGLIRDVGYEANLNKELILKIHPDITMIYGVGSESSGYVGKLQELGIRVIYNADYLETDPLGKAEWLKLFGALYCREGLADSLYNAEVQQYNDLKSFLSDNITNKPVVLLGLPFKDTWFVSPGNSFISSLIEDAGGEYLWEETKSSVSMPFGLENVYLKAIKADFWLNIGTVRSKTEISAVDPRLTDLACFKKGNLYNNNNRITEEGGNDFWESGTLFPHIILKDIASILHPDLFPGYELFYYRKVI